jgi:hypothetical protein
LEESRRTVSSCFGVNEADQIANYLEQVELVRRMV